ncbi:MAG: Gfo/Idh/MocA family oxidoreductase [Gemmatimonadetes bacterium]|jgi:predicted dehydrogenase|nr:Gfo/Idh/MocA family oxidoreductase [Gemmatimonadota bacterium]MBT6143976.1 Gfo/Idh/MocA family oxidoreductase [Gemmatimonadota bacterium]MBT7859250.1 Gfo/Idh/MocA family oxidoreductase [Gemmatimonadota bacterium]
MDQATFGIIGVGGIAQSQHLPNMTRAPHVRLKTLCDLNEDLLGQMQQKYGVSETTTDYQQLLADDEIDAVVVATKEDAQADLAAAALRAGKHVYVEKPLADTVAKVEQVVAAQAASGKFAAVGFNRRMAPAYRKAMEVITADGGARNIHYRISDEYWSWGANLPPGHRVIHEICHIFDLMRYFTQADPISIYCVDSRPDDEIFVIKFPGCVASITDSGYVTMDLPKERLEIVAELGAVVVEEFVELRTYGYHDFDHIYRFAGHSHPDRDTTHKYLLQQGGAESLHALRRMGWEQRERWNREQTEATAPDRAELEHFQQGAPQWNYMVNKGWLLAIDHFAECVLSGATPQLASAEDGLWSARMTAAAIQSRETGEVVRFD